MTKALYAGSFDPVTYGHLDIIVQACTLFKKVVVGVADNENKNSLLPVSVRIDLIQKEIRDNPKTQVVGLNGLTAMFAKNYKIDVLIRGIRSESDIAQELTLARINEELTGIKTIFIPGSKSNESRY